MKRSSSDFRFDSGQPSFIATWKLGEKSAESGVFGFFRPQACSSESSLLPKVVAEEVSKTDTESFRFSEPDETVSIGVSVTFGETVSLRFIFRFRNCFTRSVETS